jgi:translation initiation factor IF-3
LQLYVIGSDGSQLGEMSRIEALEMAKEEGLDLIEVAPNAKPPVAKIFSWSKFKYQQEKKKKDSKARPVEQKEMWFKTFIGEGDFNHKIERIKEFLLKKHSVKLTIKGKNRVTQKLLRELLEKVILALGDSILEVKEMPKFEGRNLVLMVRPNKYKKINDNKNEDETKDAQSDKQTL